MATDDKYDRQIRLWGPHGQKILSSAHVLLLNANPSATEALKNLVLPGINKVTVVDGQIVTKRDLGNNFFVTPKSVGQPRAQVVCQNLIELNPDVEGDFIQMDVKEFVKNEGSKIRQFQQVIASDIDDETANQLCKDCANGGPGVIILRQYGLLGSIRNYKSSLEVIESKPSDVQFDDLRISEPFPAILEYAKSLQFETLPDNVHSHIPYNIILIKLLDEFKQHHGHAPSNEQEKEIFRQVIKNKARNYSKELCFEEAFNNAYKCFQKSLLRGTVEDIFNDPKVNDQNEKSYFWICSAALHKFYTTYNTFPVAGIFPDMTSTTDLYLDMQKIYQQKAQEDFQVMKSFVNEIAQSRSAHFDDDNYLSIFCKNSQLIEVTKMRSVEEELNSPNVDDLTAEFFDEESLIQWYIAFRAAESFRTKHGRYPGQGQHSASDSELIKEIGKSILAQLSPEGNGKIEDKYLEEMVRSADSQIHTVGAFLGGIASQEAIKMMIHQYTAFNNTLIYDGIHSRAQVLNV